MKWKPIVEDYFTFTRPQRRTVIAAVSIIIFCIAIRFSYGYFFSVKSVPADSAFLKEAARLSLPDTSQKQYAGNSSRRYSNDNDEASYREPSEKYAPSGNASKGELFAFDPNTLSADGWKRLGLRDKTIATIQNYLSKGGHFRKPEDIRRIYGLFPQQAERLLPYVKIAAADNPANAGNYAKKENTYTPAAPRPYIPATLDVNTADTTAFIALPGIGSKLAGRIVNFRERLGGFYTVEQVGETFGLPDSVFQKIKGRLAISAAPAIRKLNINTLDANGLKTNPYIRWNIANAIFQYRQQHGNYASLNDLKKIAIIDEQTWQKIQAYLTVE